MKLLNFFIFLFLFFFLSSCGIESRLKRIPLEKKVIRDVESTYNPSVDILFIIDDSGSMFSIQRLLATNARMFVDHFLGVSFINYHVGVTTSSVGYKKSLAGDGKLNKCRNLEKYKEPDKHSVYVDKNTHKGAECLKEMLKVGDDGSPTERFLNIPDLVFSEDLLQNHNAGFYRQDAHLAIFVITDTHDQSYVDINEAYKFLLNLKGGDQNKLHYALGHVITPIPSTCTREGTDSDRKLQKMVGLFDSRGYEFDLCQSDYGEDLARFATYLVESVSTISLDNVPDISSIEVYYEYEGGVQDIPNGPQGWSYDSDGNTINLSPDLQLDNEEGKFRIKYQHLYDSERPKK